MKLRYAFDEILPTTETDSEQVLSTISALARRGLDVELAIARVAGREPPTAEALRRYYQVSGDFAVRLVDSGFDRVRTLQKVALARRLAILDGEPDVFYTRNLACLAFALHAGHRVAYEHYRPWPDQYPLLRGTLRVLMKHPRFLGAVLHSDHARESYARLGIAAENLTVVHNGYDPARMEPRLGEAEARARLGLPQDRPIAVYAGRVKLSKGLDVVFEMAERCRDVLFVLVGAEGDGEVEAAARRLDNVRLVQWLPFDKVVPYLYASTVLLVPPSLRPLQSVGNTVLPMKLFLYLAAGRAVLAPVAPDTSELLKHGENSWLVRPGDAQEAAAGLARLAGDAALRGRIVAGALATAAPLTWDARAQKIERFLRERLAATPRA